MYITMKRKSKIVINKHTVGLFTTLIKLGVMSSADFYALQVQFILRDFRQDD